MMNERLTLTHRTFVNTWHCDENAHMNVRFYYGFFDEAARFFKSQRGEYYQFPKTRQVNYLCELAVASAISIHSVHIDEGKFEGCDFHFLYDDSRYELSATAIDMPHDLKALTDEDWQVLGKPFIHAKPRSLRLGSALEMDRDVLDEKLSTRCMKMTHRAFITQEMSNGDGLMRIQDYIGCFSNAAVYAWQFTGLSPHEMVEQNIGRVAVEMKLNIMSPVKAGHQIEVITGITGVQEKSFELFHIGRDLKTQEPLFRGQAIALLMNLETRRVIAFDQNILEALNRVKL